MKTTRKTIGAVAVGLMGAGILGACASTPAPTPEPGVGNSDTKNVEMSCALNIYDDGALLFPSNADYDVTLTLAADDVAVGATTTVTATVAGITNGPLPGAGGYIQADVNGGGLSDAADLQAGLANDPIVADPIVFESDPINGETQIQITGFEFHADGLGSSVADPTVVGHAHDLVQPTSVDDWSDGVCTLDPGEEPTITVGNI